MSVAARVVVEEGATVWEALSDALPAVPSAELRRALAEERVRRREVTVAAEQPVAAGDALEVAAPLRAVTPAPLRGLEVLHRGAEVWVVNKPAGVAVEPGRGQDPCDDPLRAALLHALRHVNRGGRPPRPRVAHRLDRDTSGCLAVALSRGALRALSGAFAAREVEKEYLALCWARTDRAEGAVDLSLRPAEGGRERRMEAVDASGGGGQDAKPARTRWRIVERLGRTALVQAWPETGRQHQVRVHLAAADLPLLCDPLYGDAAPLLLSAFKRSYRPGRGGERPLLQRTALHAARLAFDLPGEGRVAVEAPPPKDFSVALKQLRRWDR